MTLLQERPTRRFTASLHLRAANGTNPATRKKALIIVTDGVADYGARIIPFSKGPINPNDCSAMKAFGYSVYVLYRPYSDDGLAPPFDNAGLKDHLARVPSVMDTNLQQCAPDPGNFKDASTSADIIAGLNQLLLSAIGSAGRFT